MVTVESLNPRWDVVRMSASGCSCLDKLGVLFGRDCSLRSRWWYGVRSCTTAQYQSKETNQRLADHDDDLLHVRRPKTHNPYARKIEQAAVGSKLGASSKGS